MNYSLDFLKDGMSCFSVCLATLWRFADLEHPSNESLTERMLLFFNFSRFTRYLRDGQSFDDGNLYLIWTSSSFAALRNCILRDSHIYTRLLFVDNFCFIICVFLSFLFCLFCSVNHVLDVI